MVKKNNQIHTKTIHIYEDTYEVDGVIIKAENHYEAILKFEEMKK